MSYPSILDYASPSSVRWGIQSNNFTSTSFANITQAVTHPGALWRGSMMFDLTNDHERENLEIFLEGLEGRAGRFKVFNPVYKTYPAQGTPVVGQSNQTGRLLYTSGWLHNRLVMRKGQLFTINHELKRCTKDIYSSAIGVATLEFSPRIRIIPSTGTTLEIQSPYMLATLDKDFNPLDFDSDFNAKVSIAFTEAIYERV